MRDKYALPGFFQATMIAGMDCEKRVAFLQGIADFVMDDDAHAVIDWVTLPGAPGA
jgi:hypothetical protein